jgi:hypothetical protein
MAKHLDIFGNSESGYGVMLGDYDPDDPHDYATAIFFDTLAKAKEFVALVRAGASEDELNGFVEAHHARERITVEELRRRAETDDSEFDF